MAKDIDIIIRDAANNHEGELEVRLHEDFPLAINYSIAEIRDLTRRAGGWTKSFLIPATQHNNDVLNRIFDTNIQDTKNTLGEKTATIAIEGLPVLDGFLKLKGVAGNSYPLDYEFNMFGDNLVWITAMESCKIADIAWGSIDVEASSYEANWAAFEAFNVDFVFPVINYGKWSGLAPDNQQFVRVEDLRPAVRIEKIVRQSMADVGYQLISDFWDGNHAAFDARRLVLPYLGDSWALDEGDIDAAIFFADISSIPGFTVNNLVNNNPRGFVSGSPGSQITASDIYKVVFDNESTPSAFYDNTTGIYSGISGKVSFHVDMGVEYTADTNNITNSLYFVVIKESGGIKTAISSIYQRIGLFPVQSFNVTLDTGIIFLNSTDQVYVAFWVGNDFMADAQAQTLDVTIIQDSIFYNEVSDAIIRGQTVDISEVVPDIDCLDVILGTKHLFNLYFKTDVLNRKIYCEPRDTFYEPFSAALDWTEKLHVPSIAITFLDDYKRDLLFAYRPDSADGNVEERDKWAKDFYGTIDYELHSGRFGLSDRYTEGISRIENDFFSPTYYLETSGYGFVRDKSIAGIHKAKFPSIAVLWQEPGSPANPPDTSYDFEPRILFYQYKQNGGGFRWDDGTGLDYDVETDIPTAHPGGSDYAHSNGFPMLGFKNGKDLDGVKVPGLLENFYNNALRTIEKGIMLSADINLTLRDIHSLDLRIPIYFDGPAEIRGYWAIEQINDYRPADDVLTKVDFIKLESFDPVDIESISFAALEIPPGAATTDHYVTVTRGVNEAENIPQGEPTYSLGTNNQGLKGGQGVMTGNNLQLKAFDQVATGSYNRPDDNAVWMMGSGDPEQIRRNSLMQRKDGVIQPYGGQIFTEDVNGNIIAVMITDIDDNYQFTYLDDSI